MFMHTCTVHVHVSCLFFCGFVLESLTMPSVYDTWHGTYMDEEVDRKMCRFYSFLLHVLTCGRSPTLQFTHAQNHDSFANSRTEVDKIRDKATILYCSTFLCTF
jgi:hypothetical protein